LWVFVGHTVTGGKSQEDKEALTDVEQIVAFFDDFLRHRNVWTERIDQMLRGETGLKNPRDEDIFNGLFSYLKTRYLSAEAIYADVVKRVFWANTGELVRAVELKAAPGEIGLRTGADSPYFAVINIGDVSGLMKLFEDGGILREDENISGLLFTRINDPNSPVNVLIGSRKFMEGWDSFRVSSMGLMNIGRGEGAQIIQLFGRGVRLWGKGLSLKRSSAVEPNGAPPHIRVLETLDVFGVRANYMAQFREYLKQEGIETEFEEIHLPIRVQEAFLDRELQVLRLPEGERFGAQGGVVLEVEDSIKVTLDLRPRLEVARSGAGETEATEKAGGADKASDLQKCAPLFNWQRITFDLLAFKRLKGLSNVSFTEARLREVIEKGCYEVLCPDGGLPPTSYPGLRRAEDMAIAVLQKYVSTFYDRKRRAWEQENIKLAPLSPDDPNLRFGGYTLRVKAANRAFLEDVHDLVQRADEVYQKDLADFPNIHFDRHLYQPLLVTDKQERLESAPAALNEGEAQFVRDLRAYLQSHKAEFEDREVFLLRNLTRGKGIGFFEAQSGEAFYPDFILWVIQDRQQWITFIDPHGLRMARGGFNDPKMKLHEDLRALEPALQAQCAGWQVHLTSFILSTSSFSEIGTTFGMGQHSKEEFEDHNILFTEDAAYSHQLFQKVVGIHTANP
jgi:hypothetical protein